VDPADVTDDKRAAVGGTPGRLRVQAPVDGVGELEYFSGEFRVFRPGLEGDRTAGRQKQVGPAVESGLALGHAAEDDGDLARRWFQPPKVDGQRNGVAHHDVRGRQGKHDPQTPESVEQQVERQVAGVVHPRQAQVDQPAMTFVIGQAGPAAGDDDHIMALPGHQLAQTQPDFFRGAAGKGGHGKEKSHHDGDSHDF
jgi:hypothetical protein